MIKVLFICHGNICRSPIAEFVMKDLVAKAGLSDAFEIASAATSREELGNSVYPPARRKLAEHGISCAGKTARQITTICAICAASSARMMRVRCPFLWITPIGPVTWPTRGTPATLRQPGGTYWRAVLHF